MTTDAGPKAPAWIDGMVTAAESCAAKALEGFSPVGTMVDAPWITYNPVGSGVTTWSTAGSGEPADIVDRIDKLASEEKCPHCDRDWHATKLTARMWQMYEADRFDPNYFTGDDYSRVLCEGSEFIGPVRPKDWRRQTYAGGGVIGWSFANTGSYTITIKPNVTSFYDEMWKTVMLAWPEWEIPKLTTSLWLPGDPQPECTDDLPEVDVEFGPQNWGLDFQYIPQQKQFQNPWVIYGKAKNPLQAKVHNLWSDFTASDIPALTRPGYDFSQFDTKFPQYPTSKKGKK